MIEETVDLSFIRYANCWEDAEILINGLMPNSEDKILSIGSGGDNSLALLRDTSNLVIAVDLNKAQLLLIELKATAIKHLSYDDTLQFLGFQDHPNRLDYYNFLKKHLSKDAITFWEKHLDKIQAGIIHMGKFENYFQLFSKKILPWIHNEKKVKKLFSKKTGLEQQIFFQSEWNTWKWRTLFKIFFSKTVMGKLGRDPQFLKEVQVNVAQYILERASKELTSESAQTNYLLKYALTARYDDLLPPYLLKENFDLIKAKIDQLQLHHGNLESTFTQYGTFDKMNLSNIFEYMDFNTFIKEGNIIGNNLNDNGRVAYWNLMVPRRLSEKLPNKFIFLKKESLRLTNVDRGFFYQQFIIDEKL